MVYKLRLELEDLYAQRTAVDAAIHALQGLKGVPPARLDALKEESNFEFRPHPCNLTNCRSA